MNHVDLQRRREDHARARRKPETSWRNFSRSPLLLLGTGFVLGALSPGIYNYMFFPVDRFFLSATVMAVVAVLSCYVFWPLLRQGPAESVSRFGVEKQLLMVVQGADGGITPVEAALETSLTVDEAEEILTRFADRGHLVVESRDGALFYTLPGRRAAPETRTV